MTAQQAPSALKCPRCRQPMQIADLHASTGSEVEVDLCEACRLVWFDERESLRLSGLGWIGLLGRLRHDAPARDAWSGDALACVICREPLQLQANQTKYGRFIAHCCARGHGALRSEATLLAERGLVRPPTTAERLALQAEHGTWSCLNCGAPVEDGGACTWCKTPLLLFDLPRLALSLQPQSAGQELKRTGARDAWHCHGCGHVLDPTRETACPQCKHPVLARSPVHLRPVLAALEQTWRAWLNDPRNMVKVPVAPARRRETLQPGSGAGAMSAAVSQGVPALAWKIWFVAGFMLAALWAALLL